MFMRNDNLNNIYIVRYGFNDSKDLHEKTFSSEEEAYGFYHGLTNVRFRCFKILSTVTVTTVVLYEGVGKCG